MEGLVVSQVKGLRRLGLKALGISLAIVVLAGCTSAASTSPSAAQASRPAQSTEQSAAAPASPSSSAASHLTGADAVVLGTSDVPAGFTGQAVPLSQLPVDPGVSQAAILYSGASGQSMDTSAFVFPSLGGAQAHLAYLIQTQPGEGTPESPSRGLGQESHLYVSTDTQEVLLLWRDRTVVCMLVTSGLTTAQALQLAARQEAHARALLGG